MGCGCGKGSASTWAPPGTRAARRPAKTGLEANLERAKAANGPQPLAPQPTSIQSR